MSNSTSATSFRSLGEELWKKTDKANADFFSQLYGAFMKSMWGEFNDAARMTAYQQRMAKDMGARLADEFFARSGLGRCKDLRESADVLAKAAFKMFLNVTPAVSDWSGDGKAFTLAFEEDPLTEGVVLPESLVRGAFSYSGGFYGGAIVGAFEAMGVNLHVQVLSDKLLGAESTSLRVTLIGLEAESAPPEDD